MNGKFYGQFLDSIVIPFAVKRLSKGRVVFLNRNYKPLGVASLDHVDYEPYGLDVNGSEKWAWNDEGLLWLYDDASSPRLNLVSQTNYMKKLFKLLHNVRVAGVE